MTTNDSESHEIPPVRRGVMLFDGTCGFCKFWIERWRHRTGSRVEYRPFQEAGHEFPQIAPGRFEEAVQLVEEDGRVSSGAEAVFRACELGGNRRPWPRSGMPMALANAVYGFVAGHRVLFSWLTRVLFGRDPRPASYLVGRWIFTRALGLVYFFAFLSLALQIRGLLGRRGILPVAEFLAAARERIGSERYWLLPSWTWLNASDGFLMGICVFGIALSLAVMAGFWPSLCLLLLWSLYLSIVTVSRVFLGYQWDALLLEAGLLAVLLTGPLAWRPRWNAENPSARIARWLLLWLLFRLTFESGVVKLASGDSTWRNLTALAFHYETQPLPIWPSWYAHQAPLWWHKASCAGMFAIELAAPFAIFGPRNVRIAGAGAMLLLQGGIAATGNYTFFNLLTASLCLLLLDDRAWPAGLRGFVTAGPARRERGWPLLFTAPVSAVAVSLTGVQLLGAVGVLSSWPQPLAAIHAKLAAFRSFNSYGLFAVMTTRRPEIILEGSRDGEHWTEYEFKWKPGDVNRRPRLVAPFQPRLDWQMWFAALGGFEQNPWLAAFIQRLLEGAPEATALLGRNPFVEAPPRFIRAVLYDYHFTTRADRTKAWWKREYTGIYCPALTLNAEGELGMRR
jgi:predicted DCC family thiol-disulfide oxidoreductase YuxK